MKWDHIKLGDAATFINGYPFKPTEWSENGREIIRIQNLTKSTDIKANRFDGKIAERYLVKKGDLLISWSGTLGVYEWDGEDAWLNQHIFKVVLDKKDINKKYFKYLIQSKISELERQVHGATMKHITKGKFDNIQIPLPPLPIQQQIADTLDKADALRRKDQELLEKYDELAQAVFYEMFGDPVINEKGWNIFKIRDVCDFSQGIQIPVEEHYFECTSGMKRFLRISDYTQSVEPRYVVTDENKAWVEKDDIVMVRYGASAGFIGFGLEGILANNLFKFNIDKKTLVPYYLLHFLNTTYFQNFIKRVAFGAAMPALSFRSFDDVNIPVPDIKIQIAFSTRIKNIIDQRNLCISTLNESLSLFNSELNKTF